jgi:hypothetical protein
MKNIQISDELHKQLKTHCAEQGLLIRFYVERLIKNELENEKGIKVFEDVLRETNQMDRINYLLEKRKSAANKHNTSK